MAVIAWDCADDAYREHAYKCMAVEVERLRKSLEQIDAVCADNASPRCNKGMALKFIADVVRVTLTNGHRGSEG